jgi:uncharacterized damage-inducible protein DinB
MRIVDALAEAWDRQAGIVYSVAERVNESNRSAKPSPDGGPLDHQLAHIHEVRYYWTSKFSPKHAEGLGDAFLNGWENPISDLDAIRSLLKDSARAVREAFIEGVQNGGGPAGGYDNPVLFLEHMIWHDGWHVGLIFLGLRLAGQEPPEAWEEEHVWGRWRVE